MGGDALGCLGIAVLALPGLVPPGPRSLHVPTPQGFAVFTAGRGSTRLEIAECPD